MNTLPVVTDVPTRQTHGSELMPYEWDFGPTDNTALAQYFADRDRQTVVPYNYAPPDHLPYVGERSQVRWDLIAIAGVSVVGVILAVSALLSAASAAAKWGAENAAYIVAAFVIFVLGFWLFKREPAPVQNAPAPPSVEVDVIVRVR
jgi:hypothetical protein